MFCQPERVERPPNSKFMCLYGSNLFALPECKKSSSGDVDVRLCALPISGATDLMRPQGYLSAPSDAGKD
jgi:hypothetical protein